jgi:hypothetical protein
VANEITPTASLTYADSENADVSLTPLATLVATVASKKFIHNKQNIGTAEEAVVLGEVTTPGWAIFINRDLTNFIELRVATGGAKFAKLLPGEFWCGRLGSGAQAPFAIADTGACQMEYLICNT